MFFKNIIVFQFKEKMLVNIVQKFRIYDVKNLILTFVK